MIWPHPKLTWEDVWINRAENMRGVRLSSLNNEVRMERLVQDALDAGYSDEEAIVVANKKWDNFVDNIHDDEEIIVCYCDNPYLWKYNHFRTYVEKNNVDGCILTHSGFHPHRLSSTYMAYCKTEGDLLIEIKEKEPYTDNHMEEHASTGTYYFRKGSYIKKYFQDAINNEVKHTNGEYYVTLVYNLLVADGLDVRVYDTDYVTVFGTPEEVENYEAWNTILSGGQVDTEEDLIKCYNYWKSYSEQNS